jgi:hypothetical protein
MGIIARQQRRKGRSLVSSTIHIFIGEFSSGGLLLLCMLPALLQCVAGLMFHVVVCRGRWRVAGGGLPRERSSYCRAGTEKYVDRGIIPRTISMLFNEFSRRSDYTFQVIPRQRSVARRHVSPPRPRFNHLALTAHPRPDDQWSRLTRWSARAKGRASGLVVTRRDAGALLIHGNIQRLGVRLRHPQAHASVQTPNLTYTRTVQHRSATAPCVASCHVDRRATCSAIAMRRAPRPRRTAHGSAVRAAAVVHRRGPADGPAVPWRLIRL